MYDLFDHGSGSDWFEPYASIAAHDPGANAPSLSAQDFTNLLPRAPDRSLEDDFTQPTPAEGLALPTQSKADPVYPMLALNGDDDVTEVEEVVITAQPGMPIDEINQILDDLYGGNGVDPGQPTGGGGNNSDPAEEECGCPSTGASQEQEEARSSAAEGADIILQQNWENQEYGGFIYRDAITGEIKMGVITGSAVTTWSPSADNMQGISSYSQIIGIVHSHGPNVPGSNHNFPSSGDWDAFNALIAMGAINLTAYYIVGADGQLREYDGVDQTNTNSGEVVSGC